MIEQHRGQADGDGDAGKGDRTAGGRHGDRDRILSARACSHLIAKAIDDEQRVIDRERETDQGDDVGRVLRHVGEACEHHRAAKSADDREQPNAEREKRSDDRGEDEDEHQERDWKRDVLRALKVRVQRRVKSQIEWNLASGNHRQWARPKLGDYGVDVSLGLH